MFDEWSPKHRASLGHITEDVQAITAYMVQGWIWEVNQSFGRVGHGEQLGESYTRCIIVCQNKVLFHGIVYVKLCVWASNHEIVYNM